MRISKLMLVYKLELIVFLFLQGVYDVTDFIAMHPGGDKILLAAGAAVDPFWALYSQHKTKEVLEILEGYRIGKLDVKDVPKVSSWSRKEVAYNPLLCDL